MTSIIKVDTIQTSAGGTPTASSLGIDIGNVGKIGQVVSQSTGGTLSTSSTSFVQNFSASITPSSTSSKILIAANSGRIDSNTNGNQIAFTIYRDGTNLFDPTVGISTYYFDTAVAHGNMSISYLDSPSTTSAITYYMYYRVAGGGGTVWLNNAGTATITLMGVLA